MALSRPSCCAICDKEFSNKPNVYRHIRKVHKARVIIKGTLKCPLCDANPTDYDRLRKHIKNAHQYQLEKEELTFSSFEEFETWKISLEQCSNYRYIRRCGARFMSGPSRKGKLYFFCHRSGFFKPKDTGKRKHRYQGSGKINSHCPSTLEVVINELGCVSVTYWRTHVGHDPDIQYAFLTLEERALIAEKIVQGKSFEDILCEVKELGKELGSLRLQALNRRDLHNIKRNCQNVAKDLQSIPVRENSIKSVLLNAWKERLDEPSQESPATLISFCEEHALSPEHKKPLSPFINQPEQTVEESLIVQFPAAAEFYKDENGDIVFKLVSSKSEVPNIRTVQNKIKLISELSSYLTDADDVCKLNDNLDQMIVELQNVISKKYDPGIMVQSSQPNTQRMMTGGTVNSTVSLQTVPIQVPSEIVNIVNVPSPVNSISTDHDYTIIKPNTH